MNHVASTNAERLERLENYLREDPENPALLADVCEAAIAAARHDRALTILDLAQRLGLDPGEWTFRRARLSIARRDLQQAASLLEGLLETAGDHPAVTHDLAYVRFLQGDLTGCRALLQPWLERMSGGAPAAMDAGHLQPLQALWLRTMHRADSLDEGWAWAEAARAAGTLQPAAQGVASLMAIDLDRFEAARDLSDAALAVLPVQLEALVARATVAMAEGDNGGARVLLQRALQINPEDGRTGSALGFASLQARDIPLAQAQLERAVITMPSHIGTWHALGWARLLQENRAGALEAFRRALELDRNFAESHGALGLVLAFSGEVDQARHHIDVAGRLDPNNVTGRYARAVLQGEAGDAERLAALAGRLLDRPGFLGAKLSEAVTKAVGRSR
jgi:Flp pilus assembly protein TadD